MIRLSKYYINRIFLWLHRKQFKYWWISLHCNLCGKDVFKHKGDYFMLKDEVWNIAIDTPYTNTKMILCKKCVERLLERKLTKDDYYEEKEN